MHLISCSHLDHFFTLNICLYHMFSYLVYPLKYLGCGAITDWLLDHLVL